MTLRGEEDDRVGAHGCSSTTSGGSCSRSGTKARLTHEVGGTTDEAAWIPIAEVAGLERVDLVDAALRLAQR